VGESRSLERWFRGGDGEITLTPELILGLDTKPHIYSVPVTGSRPSLIRLDMTHHRPTQGELLSSDRVVGGKSAASSSRPQIPSLTRSLG
jgi:hypothetical protein